MKPLRFVKHVTRQSVLEDGVPKKRAQILEVPMPEPEERAHMDIFFARMQEVAPGLSERVFRAWCAGAPLVWAKPLWEGVTQRADAKISDKAAMAYALANITTNPDLCNALMAGKVDTAMAIVRRCLVKNGGVKKTYADEGDIAAALENRRAYHKDMGNGDEVEAE